MKTPKYKLAANKGMEAFAKSCADLNLNVIQIGKAKRALKQLIESLKKSRI